MMRIAVVAGILLACTVPAWAEEIYHWKDAEGQAHYTNSPGDSIGSPSMVPRDEGETPAGGAGAVAPAPVDDPEFSTSASLRRNSLERELHATDRRLHELDGRIETLARARAARGVPAAAGNLDLRSEEEKALAAERDQVVDHQRNLQSDYAKLREEVTNRLGSTPDWWVEVRPDRH
jgi:hypothetical protein